MKEKLNQNVSELKLDKKTVQKLEAQELKTVNDLWHVNRKELKRAGFTDSEIHQIIIQLELYGLDLGHRVWKY